jgi:hypothetical protein
MLSILQICRENATETKAGGTALATASTIAMAWILQYQGDNEEASRYYMEAHRLLADVRGRRHAAALTCWKLSRSLKIGRGTADPRP